MRMVIKRYNMPIFCTRFVHWLLTSFLYCPTLTWNTNYCDSKSSLSFSLLKRIAKCNRIIFLLPLRLRKGDNYCFPDSWKNIQEKNKIINTKNEAKKI